MTSIARGKNVYAFNGCKHAIKVAGGFRPLDAVEGWRETEMLWELESEKLFKERTATWKTHEAEAFARALLDSPFIPGAIAELPFAPDPEPEPAHISDEDRAF